MTFNHYAVPMVAFESVKQSSIEPMLAALAQAAQELLDNARAEVCARVRSRLGKPDPINDMEFWMIFEGLDPLCEEVYLHEYVGISQRDQANWRREGGLPAVKDRHDVLTKIVDWVEKRPHTTGEQIIFQEVDDLGWCEAYPVMPD
jgi:hypothetical protein